MSIFNIDADRMKRVPQLAIDLMEEEFYPNTKLRELWSSLPAAFKATLHNSLGRALQKAIVETLNFNLPTTIGVVEEMCYGKKVILTIFYSPDHDPRAAWVSTLLDSRDNSEVEDVSQVILATGSGLTFEQSLMDMYNELKGGDPEDVAEGTT